MTRTAEHSSSSNSSSNTNNNNNNNNDDTNKNINNTNFNSNSNSNSKSHKSVQSSSTQVDDLNKISNTAIIVDNEQLLQRKHDQFDTVTSDVVTHDHSVYQEPVHSGLLHEYSESENGSGEVTDIHTAHNKKTEERSKRMKISATHSASFSNDETALLETSKVISHLPVKSDSPDPHQLPSLSLSESSNAMLQHSTLPEDCHYPISYLVQAVNSANAVNEVASSMHEIGSFVFKITDHNCRRGGAKVFTLNFTAYNPSIPASCTHSEISSNNDNRTVLQDFIFDAKVYSKKGFFNKYSNYARGMQATTSWTPDLACSIVEHKRNKDSVLLNISCMPKSSLSAFDLHNLQAMSLRNPRHALSVDVPYIINFYASNPKSTIVLTSINKHQELGLVVLDGTGNVRVSCKINDFWPDGISPDAIPTLTEQQQSEPAEMVLNHEDL